ncbi:MAG TPA: serine hydrolase domain-containing protein, partial [Myxococcota bacterium]|nr:serine hydrolase domain-containing protein [Myxococcota bacterium]
MSARCALAATLALAALVAAAPVAARPSLDDASDVEGFVTGFLEAELRERHVPGAVFVLVRGDRVVLARGFGLANVAAQTPVDPKRTAFRVASVSKLFTATAVMQLVEEGRLGLDDDVNAHLRSVRVPEAFGEPVRVRHLLTHTAGLDDRFVGMAALTDEPPEALAAHLARRLPARVFPPGRAISYSNYGIALLGVLVEDVGGKPFEVTVDERILRPLGMPRSSFRPDAALRADLATGYARRGTDLRPLPWDSVLIGPAGGLVATGADMARFVRANLRGGAVDGARVLRPETLAEMHRTQFRHDPELPGVGLAFHEREHGPHRALEHAGDWGGFASLLQLVPESDFGFFLSYNVDDPGLRERFATAFLTRYLSVERPPLPEPAAGAQERARAVAGWYRWNRTTRADLTKVFAPPVHVVATGGGEVRIGSPGSPFDPLALREVAPDRYAASGGDEAAVFRTDETGRELFLSAFGLPLACEGLAWWQTPIALIGGAALFLAMLLSALF